jgi:hypothetical protein
MAGKGGATPNSGRKPKVEEEHSNFIFLSGIKKIKGVDTDEEAKIELVVDLYKSDRGKIFIAEHIFGKPNQVIDLNNNIKGEIPVDKWLSQ